MKHVVSISYGSSKSNYETVVDFFGEPVRVSQFGADFDDATMEVLLKKFDGACDVIAVSGFQPPVKIGRRVHYHPDSMKYMSIPQQTPVTAGTLFRKVFIPWAVQNQVKEKRISFENRKVSFLSGLVDQELATAVCSYTERVYFADPYMHFGAPTVLKGMEELTAYTRRMRPFLLRKKVKPPKGKLSFSSLVGTKRFKESRRSDFFVASATLLERVNLEALKGRTIIVDTLPAALERDLREAKVKDVIRLVPDIPGVKIEQGLRYSVLEALIQCVEKNGVALDEDDIITFITRTGLKPTLRNLSDEQYRPVRKFAFIIHPLSVRDFFRHPALKPLRLAAAFVEKPMEKGLSKLNGIRYGKIRGIRSTTSGETVEGVIYTLFDTPRQLLRAKPEDVYEKLVRVCEHAAKEGCDIIGLGAFTKVVGDAGVTVAAQSPIPVTTGNSLSASATLWAARVAVEKMGFLPRYRAGKHYGRGTVMVVGATGSIGKVCAKLLANVCKRLILVSPTGSKLIELREEMKKAFPRTQIDIGTNPDRFAPECDIIVLSTSSIDGGVLDLMRVKPGCVISDVSRPLAFSAKESMQRPDVLIVESGEVVLPGKVELTCDIGLDESVVYACLAETALLALDGRFESFTLSRNISYEKVREIYDMAKRHGAQLAEIRGPTGLITDQEIQLCREYALKALPLWKGASPKSEEKTCRNNTSQSSIIRSRTKTRRSNTSSLRI